MEQAGATPAEGDRPHVHTARIVIIDDDRVSAMLLERVLRQHGFDHLEVADEPEQGLHLVLEQEADLLLLDLHMPRMDGFGVMQRIRVTLPPDKRPAVLMLTADAAPDVKEQALSLGVRDFLTKPFPPVETVLRVENLLEVRLLTKQLADENARLATAAAERAAELAAVLHAAADAIVGIDAGGLIASWNRGAEELFGWTQDQIVGRPFLALLPPRLHHEFSAVARGLREKDPDDVHGWAVDTTGIRWDGQEFPAEVSLAAGAGDVGTFYVAVIRDVTARRRAETEERARAELEQSVSEIRLAMATEDSLDDALQHCAELLVRYHDAAFARVWLATPDEATLELAASAGIYSRSDRHHAHIPVGSSLVGTIAQTRRAHLTNDVATDVDPADRAWASRAGMVGFAGHPLEIDGRLLGVLAMFSRRPLEPGILKTLDRIAAEVSAGVSRRRGVEALQSEQAFVSSLLENLEAGIVACDAAGRVTVFNEAARRWYGGTVKPAPPDQWPEVYSFFHADGITPVATDDVPLYRALQGIPVRDVEMVVAPPFLPQVSVIVNAVPLHDERGRMTGAVAVFHDVTDRQRVEAELHRRTFRDTLTGLANRALFLDRLERARERLDPDAHAGAVLTVGIDNFKLVNDSLGQEAGDRVLLEMARRLERAAGSRHTAARIGGDEFALLCDEATDEREVFELASDVVASAAGPVRIDGRELHLTASVGIAPLDPDRTATLLLSDAASAMSRAKSRGRGGIESFDQALRERAMARLEIEHALRGAIDRGELVVHFQPEVRLGDGRITAAEALVRWEHPERGLVPPGDFIPVAEETGMILPMGEWVLGEACRFAARWAEENPHDPVTVAVNLSALQLDNVALVEVVQRLVDTTRIHPSLLCLEITESVLMTDAETSIRVLRALKAVGVRLAVDDFGTGYSSLSYLKRFPVDYLKIDRSFVSGLGRDPEDTAIVVAVMGVARALGLSVIAEGVETDLQLRELRRLGCDLGQGWLWSKAVDAEAFGRLLAARDHPPAAC